MKSIYATFSDDEFKKIEKAKNRANLSWEKFILFLIKNYEKIK